MKRISYITVVAALVLGFAGCAKDAATENKEGKGKLDFSLKFNGKATRGEDNTPENCLIRIVRDDISKVVYKYDDVNDIPEDGLWLTSGDYTIVVEAGVKENYSFDGAFYKGSQSFEIKANDITNVSVDCTIQNALFTVAYDSSITDYFTDYGLTLYPVAGSTSATLDFGKDASDKTAYVMLGKTQSTIDWAFEGIHSEYGSKTKNGTLSNLEPGKKYGLTFKFTPDNGFLELGLTVVVDDATDDHSHNIPIFQRPRINALNFTFGSEPLEQADYYEMLITASSEIDQILLSGSVFSETTDILADGFSKAGVDVERLSSEDGAGRVSLTFTQLLFREMFLGENGITIKVIDEKGKSNQEVFRINVTEISGPIGVTNAVPRADVWATHVDVSGLVSGAEDDTEVKFGYRVNPDGEWKYKEATAGADGKYTARISGLLSDTSYQTVIVVDGRPMGSGVAFTTEAATVLLNGGFEEWWTRPQEGLPILGGTPEHRVPYLEQDWKTERQFWSSGNQGSATLGLNVTTDNRDDKPTGSQGSTSANLKSAFVGVGAAGKFAAGNLFVGNYVKTNGTSGGIVEFGKPFTARPSALKGYYKASPGIVDYDQSNSPIKKGAQDEYQIYICLTDWNEPHQVDTSKESTFMKFNPDPTSGDHDPGIIAFGEVVGAESTNGQWVSFEIRLKYRSLTRIPKYIAVVCTASRYGDYFTGSTSSWLRVDDFELIYDDEIKIQD